MQQENILTLKLHKKKKKPFKNIEKIPLAMRDRLSKKLHGSMPTNLLPFCTICTIFTIFRSKKKIVAQFFDLNYAASKQKATSRNVFAHRKAKKQPKICIMTNCSAVSATFLSNQLQKLMLESNWKIFVFELSQ